MFELEESEHSKDAKDGRIEISRCLRHTSYVRIEANHRVRVKENVTYQPKVTLHVKRCDREQIDDAYVRVRRIRRVIL